MTQPPTSTDMPLSSDGFTGVLGIEFSEVSPDRVVASWPITPHLHQPYGIVHGGVHCSVVETVASYGGAVWFGDRGHVVGVSNTTDFLRAVREGVLTATGTPIHRGRLQQLWLVEITDEEGRLVARGQVRLQNIEDAARLGTAQTTAQGSAQTTAQGSAQGS